MNIRHAVINIGSNSVKLLAPNGSILGYRNTIVCQLAKGRKNGYLLLEAMDGAYDAVMTLYREALTYKPDGILIYATEAVRAAANKSYLLNKIKGSTGIDTDVIDGATEAFCSYLGALGAFPDLDCTVDIGGASTEIVRVENGSPDKKSYLVGTLQLVDLFGQDFDNHLDSARYIFRDMPSRAEKKVVGTSGTFASLAVVAGNMKKFSAEAVHGFVITKSLLYDLTDQLSKMSPQQINKAFPAIDTKRANVLKPGLAIVNAVMEKSLTHSVTVSSADGLTGYLVYKKLC